MPEVDQRISRITKKIGDEISRGRKLKQQVPMMRKAKVKTINTGDNTLDLDFTTDSQKATVKTVAHVPRLASYSPVANDDVWVMSLGRGRLLVIGKEA